MSGIIKEMHRVVANIVGDDDKASDIVYALMKNFGGSQFYLPGNDYELRNREIKNLKRKGLSHRVLASRFKLSIKTVYRIVKSK